MKTANVLAHLDVTDFDRALSWYEKLFGRPADRQPMNGTAEWQLTESGGIQIYGTSGTPTTVVLGVTDVDAAVREITERGIPATVDQALSGVFRISNIVDPDGNIIVLSSKAGG